MDEKIDQKIDRRLLIKGLLGIAGAGAIAMILPRQAQALPGFPSDDLTSGASEFPELDKFTDAFDDGDAPVLGEGVELASHRHRRRRRRRRRWRRYCRREWWYGHYRRRCRRRRVWIWFWI
jgi:hypothetical protein